MNLIIEGYAGVCGHLLVPVLVLVVEQEQEQGYTEYFIQLHVHARIQQMPLFHFCYSPIHITQEVVSGTVSISLH